MNYGEYPGSEVIKKTTHLPCVCVYKCVVAVSSLDGTIVVGQRTGVETGQRPVALG